jgi:hypothetical protein
MFSPSGGVARTLAGRQFTGIAVRGCTIFSQDFGGEQCVVCQ